MVMFFIALLVALLFLAVWKKNYQKEFLDRQVQTEGKKKSLRLLLGMGLWIYDSLAKRQSSQREEEKEWAEALYVGEDSQSKMRLQGAKQMASFWICLFAASVLGIGVAVSVNTSTSFLSCLIFSL